MTGRRRSFMQKWAPPHQMTVEEATKKFPDEAEISLSGEPEEIADLLVYGLTCRKMDDWNVRPDERR